MNPPSVYELTIPNAHKISSSTAIVHNIARLLQLIGVDRASIHSTQFKSSNQLHRRVPLIVEQATGSRQVWSRIHAVSQWERPGLPFPGIPMMGCAPQQAAQS